jgi:hypothetical protein
MPAGSGFAAGRTGSTVTWPGVATPVVERLGEGAEDVVADAGAPVVELDAVPVPGDEQPATRAAMAPRIAHVRARCVVPEPRVEVGVI